MIWRLADAAYLRWTSKVSAFQKRLSDTDWENTCHQALLECFGGRRNRAVFGRIALEFPLDAMRNNRLTPEQLFKSQLGDWRLASMRPANHPALYLIITLNWSRNLLDGLTHCGTCLLRKVPSHSIRFRLRSIEGYGCEK